MGPSWHIKAAGDFNGDSFSDILWQNDNGQAAVWLMNGTNLVGGSVVGPAVDPSWHVKAAGDFNDDFFSDILWQNDNGQAAVWLMNGTNLVSGGVVGPNPGADWNVARGQCILAGGSGDDTFVFGSGFGADVVLDFAAGAGLGLVEFNNNVDVNAVLAASNSRPIATSSGSDDRRPSGGLADGRHDVAVGRDRCFQSGPRLAPHRGRFPARSGHTSRKHLMSAPRNATHPDVAEALRECRRAFWSVALFSGVVNLLMLAGPLYMLQIYDRVLSSRSVPTLVALSFFLVGAYAFQGALDLIRSRVVVRSATLLDQRLAMAVHGAVIRLAVTLRHRAKALSRSATSIRSAPS